MTLPAPPASVDFAPSIDDVAALIRARTKDSSGNEIGTFTTTTRPTDAQAQQAIDHQVILIHTKVGLVGPACADVAKMTTAYGAAAEIELSYFPEQARVDRSPYSFLLARYEETLDGLGSCVVGDLPDDASALEPGATPAGLAFGTLDAISSSVSAFYTGRMWPALPVPPPDEAA